MRTTAAIVLATVMGALGALGASRVIAQTPKRTPSMAMPETYVLVPVQAGDTNIKMIGVTGFAHRDGRTCILVTDAGGIATVAMPCPR
jgi:hypothetical protein